jgi:hypothetical protein
MRRLLEGSMPLWRSTTTPSYVSTYSAPVIDASLDEVPIITLSFLHLDAPNG